MQIEQMSEEMLAALFEALPGEITLLNANDEVAGWNKHEKRLFHRPLSCMGLNARQCHPEATVPLVEQILNDMKVGKRDVARFWLDMEVPYDTAKHKILIEFFALRNPAGQYLGCMEYAQDVEPIRHLEGQKRLLD